MAKGLFTQGMCVLLREPVSISDIQKRLSDFNLVGQHESMDDDDAPQTLVYDYRPEANGHLLVTPAACRWPDDMGDPDESPERFVAWSLGQFGPLAFPGCLQRAGQQSRDWEKGVEEIDNHQAHLRLLISYVLGVEEPGEEDDDLPLVPEDYQPLEEMKFLTRAVAAVLEMPQALCYFNPGGEILRDEGGLRRGLNDAWCHHQPPLEMWTNVRLFRATENWSLMDTVGNGQFDLPDLEAVYHTESFQPRDIERFLRNASLCLLHGEQEVEEGYTWDGPGQVNWKAMECADALSDPPRATIRWIPQDGSQPPEELLQRGEVIEFDEGILDEEDGEDEIDDL